MRAAINACSVSGIPIGGPLLAALGDGEHDLLEEQRIAPGLLEERPPRLRRDVADLAQRVDQLLAVGLPERLELDRGCAHAPAAPVGTNVEQLRSGEAENQERAVAHPVGHVLDQLEQGLLGPVDVLEDQDQGLRLGHQLRPLACRPRDLLLAPLAVNRLEHAGGETEQIGDGIGRAAVAKLFDRDIERIVVGDVGRALDHLGERPVRDALAVRKAAPREDRRALERREKLVREAGLADAGLAVDREEVSAPVSHRAGERVLEQLELVLASDQRRDRDPAGARPSAPIAAQAQTGSARPRTSTGPISSTSIRPRVSLCAAGPTRIWPGSAFC